MIRETWRGDGPISDDVRAVGRRLADRPDCTGRFGVIGFCAGGGSAASATA